MTGDLYFDGKKYISSRRAAEIFRYSNDYIGQLARDKKIDARMVGRSWFVSHESLAQYSLETKDIIRSQQDKFVKENKIEAVQVYQKNEEKEPISAGKPEVAQENFLPSLKKLKTPEPKKVLNVASALNASYVDVDAPKALSVQEVLSPYVGKISKSDISKKAMSLALAVVMVFGSYFSFTNPHIASALQQTGKNISRVSGSFVASLSRAFEIGKGNSVALASSFSELNVFEKTAVS
ncbi:MAG TPA: hypothetical protein PLB51_01220, partial [Candidatus Paceibacterota bacterium]|nr:hypothetical protein [Candidatus Paceibacterota bacterium]